MRTLQPAVKRGRHTLPPPQRVPLPAARTFVVCCATCGRRFEVDRAPATCRSCGGIALAA